MRVPTSFQLFGQTIKVVRRNQENFIDTHACWDPVNATIIVQKDLQKDMAVHAFLHEFLHAAFEATGHGKESADEIFVDTLAGLLAQMLKTASYD